MTAFIKWKLWSIPSSQLSIQTSSHRILTQFLFFFLPASHKLCISTEIQVLYFIGNKPNNIKLIECPLFPLLHPQSIWCSLKMTFVRVYGMDKVRRGLQVYTLWAQGFLVYLENAGSETVWGKTAPCIHSFKTFPHCRNLDLRKV